MDFKTKMILLCHVLSLVFSLLPSTLQAQVKEDEEDIPYGLSDGDLFLVFLRNKAFVYEDYTIARTTPPQAGQTQSIEARGVNEKIYTGIGAGLDVRLALLYTFIHQNKSRLRIADDFGFGTFMSSSHLKVKDALTNQKIEPEYNGPNSATVKLDWGLTFYYGVQVVYRINNTFDAGIKWLPLFTTGSSRIKNSGTTYGLHLRAKRFYVDYRLTPYKVTKYYKYDYESNGGKFISVKYLLPEKSTFHSNGYVFASLQSFTYQSKDLYNNGNTFTPQGYENYKQEKSHYKLFKIGIGLMIN